MRSLNYQVGGSLAVRHQTYVVRQADHDLYQALLAGEFCYVLNARQMGKSSLCLGVKHRLQTEGWACAGIDVTASVANQPCRNSGIKALPIGSWKTLIYSIRSTISSPSTDLINRFASSLMRLIVFLA